MKKTDLFKDRRNFFSKLLITGTGSLAFLSLSGCNSSDSKDTTTNTTSAVAGTAGTTDSTNTPDTSSAAATGQLTDEQKDELFFIYQEEKLARDVYITLGNLHVDAKSNTFASIQKSEQRHIDAAQILCERYGIDISGVNESQVGNFVLPVLQQYYDDLVAQGSISLLEAYKVGAFIEELDIDDLTHAIEDLGMPADVISTYTNLREGSYNHLEAYETAIENY